jgi:hypothetical protein
MDRLTGHIDRLEIALGTRAALVVIVPEAGESEGEAMARHYTARPQDRDAELIVLVRRYTG